MSQRNYRIRWNTEAENLLRRRGNYMRQQIHEEFERDPEREALTFDAVRHFFVTPVANHRYSVVWRMYPDLNEAEVSAVVPTRFFAGGDLQDLKERVKSVVSMETGGRVTLDP